ncbi:MAG: hypothetical protein KDD21_11080 [Bacteroidetes bacterium]|nr:hypothetical protein [Bacteroidota bacterium]
MKKEFILLLSIFLFCKAEGQIKPEIKAKSDVLSSFDNIKNPNRLDQEFYFNKQIFFTVKLDGKVISSYFYLNTKTGYSLLDKDFFYKAEPSSKIDAHITFPKEKEYFLYFVDAYKNAKLSRITKTSIPLGPPFLEDPEEFLRYFKDWFGQDVSGTEFLGESGRLKSDAYVGAFNGSDITIYLSKETHTTIQDNYCVGWLGLGYVRLDGEFTRLITRVLSAWSKYQIDLMVEKDVNFIFDGKQYQSVQAKMNGVTTAVDINREKDKEQAQERINRTDDATEKELLARLEKAKEKKMGKASKKLKNIEVKDGKVEDFYKQMNKNFGNPLDDIDLFEAENNLKIYQTNKKLSKEKNQSKRNDLNSELQGYVGMKQKLEKYRHLFEALQTQYAKDQKKLLSENGILYQQMLQDFASGN